MRAIAVLVALLAVLAWSGCGGSSEETTAGATEEPVQTTAPEPQPEAEPEQTPDRPRAPALEGVTLLGEPIALADYRGRPVLVNVWSSW